jgi:hypothetical protein
MALADKLRLAVSRLIVPGTEHAQSNQLRHGDLPRTPRIVTISFRACPVQSPNCGTCRPALGPSVSELCQSTSSVSASS